MLEIFKTIKGISPPITKVLFAVRENHYSLKKFRNLKCNTIKTEKYGANRISYKGAQLWNQLPQAIKYSETINLFKSRIKRSNQINQIKTLFNVSISVVQGQNINCLPGLI